MRLGSFPPASGVVGEARRIRTPHNAAGGRGRLGRQVDLFGENLDRYLGHQPLLHDVTDAISASA
jgi:hypothetical protein